MSVATSPAPAPTKAPAPVPTAAPWKRFVPTPKVLILGVVALVIAYLAVVPLWFLIQGTFFDSVTNLFTLDGFKRAYGDAQSMEMMKNSIWFATGSALLSLVVGTVLAFLNVRTDVPFKAVFFAASIIPLIIPGILSTVSWIFRASPDIGLLNFVLEPVFGPGAVNIFSVWGMIWVEGLHLSPITFLFMVAAFRAQDPSLEESALMSGASRATVLRRITVPLLRPAIAASVLIMTVRALESFEVPALLGLQEGIYVFTSKIYFMLRTYPQDLNGAGALAIGLLAIAAFGMVLEVLLSRGAKAYQTVTGKGFRPRPIELGKWRPLAGFAILAYFAVTVLLPLALLIYTSLLPYYQQPSGKAFSSMGFDNYRALLDMSKATDALKNSLFLGIASATLVMILLAIAAWIVVRSNIPGRKLLDILSFTPLVVPGLVLGLSLQFVYLRIGSSLIYGTIWILLIAYCTRYMPYGMRYAVTSMQQISNELEESAAVSGATWWQVFRRVLLPLLMPGLLAGWIYIFVVSFRELSSSILLYSSDSTVLSILIWEQFENGKFTILAALGVVMIAILMVGVSIAYKLGAKVGLQQD